MFAKICNWKGVAPGPGRVSALDIVVTLAILGSQQKMSRLSEARGLKWELKCQDNQNRTSGNWAQVTSTFVTGKPVLYNIKI